MSQGLEYQNTKNMVQGCCRSGPGCFGDLLYFLRGRQNCKVLQFGSGKDLPGLQDQKCQIYFHLCVCFVLKSADSGLFFIP